MASNPDIPAGMTPHDPPRATITLDGETVAVNGQLLPVAEGRGPHETAIAEVARTIARPLGRPVPTVAVENGHETAMLIHPDGHAEVLSVDLGRPPAEAALSTPAAPTTGRPGAHRQERPSFITAGRTVQPATQGMRGALNRMGLRLDPGPAEQAYRDDVTAVAQHWPGPRTVAIVNGKGSASKTPSTACLAAVFARLGGAGVLAWDNNETRGSLPWRTETASHGATVLDLLPRVDALLAQTAQYAEMSHFVHHQPADKYDVLWSDQSVEGDHVVSADDVTRVHQVASRYYRLVITDSGNSERAPNWRAMVDVSDRLVVPCTNVEDTAEAGARLLEALAARDQHSARLAGDAVVIVSQRTPGRDQNMPRIVEGFRSMGHQVVTIPFDPALKTGVIRFDALRPATQRAWLAAAAAVARGL